MNQLKKLILPKNLESNDTLSHIKGFLSMLGPSSGYFSTLLYEKNRKYYFLNKDKEFPYVHFDWTVYSLLRAGARTIVTSGKTLRAQKQIYGRNYGTFSNQQLKQIYENNVKDPYNLVVFTKAMNENQIKQIVDESYFKLLPLKEIFTQQEIEKQFSFREMADRLNTKAMGPIIYENGQKTLNAALRQVKQKQKHFSEMIVHSIFQGYMPQKYIANEYDFSVINKDFDKVWQSTPIDSTAKYNQNGEKPISLKFIVYLRKDKPKAKLAQ